MAKIIQAIAKYAPRLHLMKAADAQHFMRLITQRTTLSTGVVRNVQESEVEALIDLLQEGRPVHTGIAIFTPTIDTQGKINVRVRVDKRIVSALNAPNVFAGLIKNSENIGLTREDYIAQWDEDHPSDHIENETVKQP